MRSTVRVIKRKKEGGANVEPVPPEAIVSETSPRDLARTIKGWITELQDRKRAEIRGFAALPAIANITAGPRP